MYFNLIFIFTPQDFWKNLGNLGLLGITAPGECGIHVFFSLFSCMYVRVKQYFWNITDIYLYMRSIILFTEYKLSNIDMFVFRLSEMCFSS